MVHSVRRTSVGITETLRRPEECNTLSNDWEYDYSVWSIDGGEDKRPDRNNWPLRAKRAHAAVAAQGDLHPWPDNCGQISIDIQHNNYTQLYFKKSTSVGICGRGPRPVYQERRHKKADLD